MRGRQRILTPEKTRLYQRLVLDKPRKKLNNVQAYLCLIKKTQRELAQYCGVTKLAAHRWCKNQFNPPSRTVENKIVEYINKHLPDGYDPITIKNLFFIEEE